MNVGEDVLVFYNDRVSFNGFVELMRTERHRLDDSVALKYDFCDNCCEFMN